MTNKAKSADHLRTTDPLDWCDRPIIFSAPMVRVLIEGRKTQTRRILKPTKSMVANWSPNFSICPSATIVQHADYDERWVQFEHPGGGPYTAIPLRRDIGDRLWVREAWGINHYEYHQGPIPKARPSDLTTQYMSYRATEDDCEIAAELCYRPSIHMPRWASRITLIVTDVRVQRLQDITEADAVAEGCCGAVTDHGIARSDFIEAWNGIYGPSAWDANPWVAALTFDVAMCNIDEVNHD